MRIVKSDRERRTISQRVILSPDFNKLTATAQLIYIKFHLLADDDGVIDNVTYRLNKINGQRSDLDELIKQGLYLSIGEDIILETSWFINTSKEPKYRPTKYQNEIQQVEKRKIDTYHEIYRPRTPEPTPDFIIPGKYYSTRTNELYKPVYEDYKQEDQQEPWKQEKFNQFIETYKTIKRFGKSEADKCYPSWLEIINELPKEEDQKELADYVIYQLKERIKTCESWNKDNGRWIEKPSKFLECRLYEITDFPKISKTYAPIPTYNGEEGVISEDEPKTNKYLQGPFSSVIRT